MERPRPTEHHARLARLAGEWTGDETLSATPDVPEQRATTGHFDNRMGVDGFYLINDYTQQRDGKVVFRGHGVYGWDEASERYTMRWFDSMGRDPGPPVLGEWAGDTLTFAAKGPHGQARYVYRIDGNDAFEFRIEVSNDGQQWTTMMAGRYTRV